MPNDISGVLCEFCGCNCKELGEPVSTCIKLPQALKQIEELVNECILMRRPVNVDPKYFSSDLTEQDEQMKENVLVGYTLALESCNQELTEQGKYDFRRGFEFAMRYVLRNLITNLQNLFRKGE